MHYLLLLVKLFATFFKIGLFSIGGGYAMLPLIKQEIVNNSWLTLEELADFVAISEMTPGPFAINIATFVGYNTGGLLGAICTTLGVMMPSLIIVTIVAKLLSKYKENKLVLSSLDWLRPAACGLVMSAALTIGKTAFTNLEVKGFFNILRSGISWGAVLIFAVVFLINWKFKPHPVLLLAISGVLGIGIFGLLPKLNIVI